MLLPNHLDFEGTYRATNAAARALIRRAIEAEPDNADPMDLAYDALLHAMHELGIERPTVSRGGRNGFSINSSRRIWDRDGWQCVTCGTSKDLTVDHIIPVSKGGTDDDDNLQTMCRSCNSRKGNR